VLPLPRRRPGAVFLRGFRSLVKPGPRGGGAFCRQSGWTHSFQNRLPVRGFFSQIFWRAMGGARGGSQHKYLYDALLCVSPCPGCQVFAEASPLLSCV